MYALNGVSILIEDGEAESIMENSGSGKSSAISAPRGATKKEKPMIERFLSTRPAGSGTD